jgi:hypothetical protein
MKPVIVVLILLVSGIAYANDLNTVEQTKELSDRIIDHFLKAEFQKGLELAKIHWPIPAVEVDALANQIKTQWPIVDQRFGKPTGKEFVKQERIGNSFIRYFYLHKFDNHSIYWRFTFYKPKNTWKINSIQFLDDLDALFTDTK